MLGLYEAIAAKIQAAGGAILQVETAMGLNALETLPLGAEVSALVMPLGDRAAPIRDAGMMVSQQETIRFGVVTTLVYPGGFPQFEAARDQVKAALRGWAPEGASMPIEYAGSRPLSYSISQDGGRWAHLWEFTVTSQETYEHQS